MEHLLNTLASGLGAVAKGLAANRGFWGVPAIFLGIATMLFGAIRLSHRWQVSRMRGELAATIRRTMDNPNGDDDGSQTESETIRHPGEPSKRRAT